MTTQADTLTWLRSYFAENREEIQRDLFTFLRFPSISTDPSYKQSLLECADWLTEQVGALGFAVERWETSGHPTLFAAHLHAPDKPTLLIYNHYDVQPVDPLEEWTTPPFEPEVRNGEVYARGAQDNKGQCFYVLQALKALLARDGRLPCNVKWLIEGEEEIGSAGLAGILSERSNQLQADTLVVVDVGLRDRNSPAVTLGIRGIVTMEVTVTGPSSDLHSGTHGGLVVNPNHALVEILAKLRDEHGRIAVPGFYDDVMELSDEEKEQIAFDFDSDGYESMFGTKAIGGERDRTPLESAWTRPTIEINGISGGYSGPGFKTVIPAVAKAKLSCRLVPDQSPQKTLSQIKEYLESVAPDGITLEVDLHEGGGPAVCASSTSPGVQAFAQAYSEVFDKPCQFIMEGGSIPIVTDLAKASNSDVVLMGFGLSDDQIHAPDEHFGLDRTELGFLTFARALEVM